MPIGSPNFPKFQVRTSKLPCLSIGTCDYARTISFSREARHTASLPLFLGPDVRTLTVNDSVPCIVKGDANRRNSHCPARVPPAAGRPAAGRRRRKAVTNEEVLKYQPQLFVFNYMLTGDYHQSLDLGQEVWLRVLKYGVNLPEDETDGFRLLARIARNAFLTGLQRRPSLPLVPRDVSGESESFQNVEREDLMRRLEQLVSSLPIAEQSVFWVRNEMRGLTWEGVAELLGISPHTAKKRYSRALRRLRVKVPRVLL